MYQMFSPESKLYQLLSKLVSSVWLNILWFLCSLPIFTIGAATAALHHVCLKLVRGEEEEGVTRGFFRAFRENFKQGTAVWLILLALGLLVGMDGYVLYHLRYDGVLWTLLYGVFFLMAAAYAIVLMWVFPLMAKFRNGSFALIKNALMIGMRFLLCSAAMAAVYFAMTLVVVRIFTPAIIFGQGTCALVCAWLYSKIILQCEEKAQEVSQ